MKRKLALLLSATLLLCSCSEKTDSGDTSSEQTTSFTSATNPFEETPETTSATSPIIETLKPLETTAPADENVSYFDKHQLGGLRYSNYGHGEEDFIEYNGGEMEISFTASTAGNPYEISSGYMAFINGIPQKLSLNGGEYSELVYYYQQPDTAEDVTIRFTPQITESAKNDGVFKLKLIHIFNPTYVPQGEFVGFGNAHNGQPFVEREIKANSPLEIVDDLSYTDEYENLVITKNVESEYKITAAEIEGKPTRILIKDNLTGTQSMYLDNGVLNSNLLMFGKDEYTYKVYVYVNHNRVSVNGADSLICDVKAGRLTVVPLELDVKERDIVYAVAIPLDEDAKGMGSIKSSSQLVQPAENREYY